MASNERGLIRDALQLRRQLTAQEKLLEVARGDAARMKRVADQLNHDLDTANTRLADERALSDALAEALLSALNTESDATFGARLRGEANPTLTPFDTGWHYDKMRAALARYDAARGAK